MVSRGAALASVALLGLAALAGCTGTPCESGETPIADAATDPNSTVTIGGTITELSASRIVLEDPTGEALLVSLEGYNVDAASTGDCAVASGTPIEHEASDEFDVVVRTTSVTLRG